MITIYSFDHMAGENQEYIASDTCVFRMGERKAFKWRKQKPSSYTKTQLYQANPGNFITA